MPMVLQAADGHGQEYKKGRHEGDAPSSALRTGMACPVSQHRARAGGVRRHIEA